MPLAQNRGSSAAPGISLRNSGENSPDTVEMLTPTFSKTRPRMTEIVPPPPPGRCQSRALEAARRPALGGARRRTRPRSPRTRRRCRSRNAANHASARGARARDRAERTAHLRSWLGEQPGLAQCLGERDRARQRDVERSRAAAQRDDDPRRCGSMHVSGTPALSRPSRIVSSAANAKRCSGIAAARRHQDQPGSGSRAARNAAHETWRRISRPRGIIEQRRA